MLAQQLTLPAVSVAKSVAMPSLYALWHLHTVKPVLRDHCQERPPVLTDHTFLAEGPTIQYN